MTTKDPTAPERVARDKRKKLAAGFVRVSLWVPGSKREQIVKYARRLRDANDGS